MIDTKMLACSLRALKMYHCIHSERLFLHSKTIQLTLLLCQNKKNIFISCPTCRDARFSNDTGESGERVKASSLQTNARVLQDQIFGAGCSQVP